MSLLSLDTYPYFEGFASLVQFYIEYSCTSLVNDNEAFEVTLSPDVTDLLSKRANSLILCIFSTNELFEVKENVSKMQK